MKTIIKNTSSTSKNDGNGITKVPETPTTSPEKTTVILVENLQVTREKRKQLTEVERKELRKLETTIRSGVAKFLEVAHALAIVRKKGYYLVKYDSIESYALSEHGYSRAYAYLLIESAEVSTQLSAIADITIIPVNEAQYRELIAVPREKREAVLRKAIASAGEKPLTATIIHVAAAEFNQGPNGQPSSADSPQ